MTARNRKLFGRFGGPATHSEYVRSQPFVDWLNERVEYYSYRSAPQSGRADLGPLELVCSDVGWPVNENGVRKLYRYRHGLVEGCRDGVKGPRPTEWFPRVVVEDALHMAGENFYVFYPEFAAERDLEVEARAWCAGCQDHCNPICGVCPWCEFKICEGHMNLGLAA